MRKTRFGILAICLIALSLMSLAACNATDTETTSTDLKLSAPLTLEQAEQQLKEKGSTFVDTIDKASQLTGYPVAMPAILPEGFSPRIITNSSAFYIYYLGFGSSSQPPEFPYDVQVTFVQTQGKSIAGEPFFMITQSRNKIGGSGADKEPVDIGGHPGEKVSIPASGKNPARLGFSWNDGTTYFVMEATLLSPLDEATLIKIASSMAIP